MQQKKKLAWLHSDSVEWRVQLLFLSVKVKKKLYNVNYSLTLLELELEGYLI